MANDLSANVGGVPIEGEMLEDLGRMLREADDRELHEALVLARAARVQVFVRGTDKNPVIELKDKLTRRIVGGSEFKRRLSDATAN